VDPSGREFPHRTRTEPAQGIPTTELNVAMRALKAGTPAD